MVLAHLTMVTLTFDPVTPNGCVDQVWGR